MEELLLQLRHIRSRQSLALAAGLACGGDVQREKRFLLKRTCRSPESSSLSLPPQDLSVDADAVLTHVKISVAEMLVQSTMNYK